MQVNTNPVVLVNRGLAHTEGGWPKEVDSTEMEQVIRFRKKVICSLEHHVHPKQECLVLLQMLVLMDGPLEVGIQHVSPCL